MEIDVVIADGRHSVFAEEICEEMFISARERGTGIARRTPDYIVEKMKAGKAVIAVTGDGKFAGFSYIETWGGKQYVANSGLIVAHPYRGLGLAKRIKERIFRLSQELFPHAKIFSITTGAAVMKMNYELGFRPVPFSALTDDPEFWKGCQGCRNYPILESNNFKMCICTGLLYDPSEHIRIINPINTTNTTDSTNSNKLL
ncbi:MAG: GNAT family N-acetyltransferase [Candidatus Cryptobacteroides sp.]